MEDSEKAYYIGFDLDETLGRFATVDGHLFFLMPSVVYGGQLKGKQPFLPSYPLQEKLNTAFRHFVSCLAEEGDELGMLRPGILQIMKKIAHLKSKEQVNSVIVYSNNGNLGCLKLATALIEERLGLEQNSLFCNHVHLWHHLRSFSDKINAKDDDIIKTIIGLKKCFLAHKCMPSSADRASWPVTISDIPTDRILFFDDLIHPRVQSAIGPQHYFQVYPYKHDVPFDILNMCLIYALGEAGLHNDDEYIRFIAPILHTFGLRPSFQSIQPALDKYNNGYVLRDAPFVDDTDLIMRRLDTIFEPRNYSENYFSVGGYLRRKRRAGENNKKKRHTRKI